MQWWLDLDPEIQAALIAVFGSLLGAFVGGRMTAKSTLTAARDQLDRDAALRHRERLEDSIAELRIALSDFSVHPETHERYVALMARARWLTRLVIARSSKRHPEFSRLLTAGNDFLVIARDKEELDGSLTKEGQKEIDVAATFMIAVLDAWLEDPDDFQPGAQELADLKEVAVVQGIPLR